MLVSGERRYLGTERERNHGALRDVLPPLFPRRAQRGPCTAAAQDTPLRQKATAARPPANTPALAVVPSVTGPATVQTLGQQLRDLLPPRRLHSVSVCDHEANVLWLSEGALGPDEHTVIMDAIGVLSDDQALACHEAA